MAIDQPRSTEFRLADIREALPRLRPADPAAASASMAHSAALGQAGTPAAELRAWLAAWQGRAEPRIERPRIVLFAGVHGATAPARAWAHADARARIDALIAGTGPATPLAEQADVDLRVYEIAVDAAARAPSEATIARAIVYGMTVVDPGLDVLAVATLSPGLQWPAEGSDPFDALCRYGGEEIAAAMGALIAARMARTPAICDGMGARLAAMLLERAQKGAADHVRAARNAAGFRHGAVLDGAAAADTDAADAAAAILALRALLAPIRQN
ncbi:MAG: nicotinate-nucleotide--dimethylbenzimidazole phosphoribosyltransferase [Alphaproteobacteria bacterium]